MIVDSKELPKLKKTDGRFKSWKKWMMPQAKFKSASGEVWEIISIDEYGNFECYHKIEDRIYNLHCDVIAKQSPLSELE